MYLAYAVAHGQPILQGSTVGPAPYWNHIPFVSSVISEIWLFENLSLKNRVQGHGYV